MRNPFDLQVFKIAAGDIIRRASSRLYGRPQNRPLMPLPALRTPREQWTRVAGVVADAQSRAARAVEAHWAASSQLDAATYALQRLHEEMAPAFLFTVARPSPPPPAPTALRREPFRRREPIAA